MDSSVLGQPDVAEKLEQAQAVIALEFSADLLDDLSHGAASMALLQVPGAGTDRIDWDSLERYPQIAVCNAAGHEKAMAEYCMLAMVLWMASSCGLGGRAPSRERRYEEESNE